MYTYCILIMVDSPLTLKQTLAEIKMNQLPNLQVKLILMSCKLSDMKLFINPYHCNYSYQHPPHWPKMFQNLLVH